jgi:hypothetical protein
MMVIKVFFLNLFVQHHFESCFVFGWGTISDDSKMARRPQGKFYFFV